MKIAIIGYGKMGHEVEKAARARKHDIIVTIDNAQEWEDRLGQLKQADVAIDFSQPDQVVGNIHRCFDLHLPVVVGTTAWQDHFEAIKKHYHLCCLKTNPHNILPLGPDASAWKEPTDRAKLSSDPEHKFLIEAQ